MVILFNLLNSKTQTYLLIFAYTFIQYLNVQGCPYHSLEDSLISNIFAFQENSIQIPTFNKDSFDSIGFGYWSQCQPLFQPKIYTQIDQEFIEFLPEDGQLQLTVYGYPFMMILYVQFNEWTSQITHQLILLDSYNFQELNYSFNSIDYEGQWIFSFITIQKTKSNQYSVIYEVNQQQSQQRFLDIQENYQAWVLLGGRGHLLGWFNLNIFRGRISKLYKNQGFNWNDDAFQIAQSFCQLPQEPSATVLLQSESEGLLNFDGTFIRKQLVDQIGDNYLISGWMKLDLSKIIEFSIFTLIRITVFTDYHDGLNDGDELFLLQVYCDLENIKNTQILVIADLHKIPLTGQLGQYSQKITQTLVDLNSENIFLGLQEWFFFQYEYGRKTSSKYGLFSIKFVNGIIIAEIGNQQYGGSFRNTQYQILIGGDEYNNNYITAQTLSLKFQYNYLEDKEKLDLTCHYSCKTCNGPLVNNCLSCNNENNFIFLEDQNLCVCISGTIELPLSQYCSELNSLFTSVKKSEIQFQELFYCPLGFFRIPNQNNGFICRKCPQHVEGSLFCSECYFYPLSWYENPHCGYDFYATRNLQDDALQFQKRKESLVDQYFIDEFQTLILKPGIYNICTSESDCKVSSSKHLGEIVTIQCKSNFIYENGFCNYPISNCRLVESIEQCLACVDGMQMKNKECVLCDKHCLMCTIPCLECEKGYILIGNECLKCGSYCKNCGIIYDFNIGKSYLKCYQCIDESKYFLSFDGISCQKNLIQNCKFAFQSLKQNIQINTLDYYFVPQVDQQQIETHCARCQNNYIYIYESRICMKETTQICQFGYAQRLTEYNTQFQVTDGNYVYSTTEQICLINQYYDPNILHFSQFCSSLIPFCAVCMIKKNHSQWDCLICLLGYYAERQTGNCRPCPTALNCLQCYQEQIQFKDYWKYQIRAFYKQFIDFDNSHPFIEYAQSQNPNDYQILCKNCQDDYELYQNICIKRCPKSCAECQIIKSVNTCMKCFKTENGIQQTIFDNECISCPEQCQFCRKRTAEEISTINPIFNTKYQELEKYSYQCLKSYKNQNYFYDQQLGTFVNCRDEVQGCQKQYQFNFNLYCSFQDFMDDVFLLKNYDEVKQFYEQNIYINDLNQIFSFYWGYNDYAFSKMANLDRIKIIIITITSKKNQTCQILEEQNINQTFSKEIFSAINVQLFIIGSNITTFKFYSSFTFLHFSEITLNGLIFESVTNQQNKQILFTSEFSQTISLKNIYITQSNIQSDSFFISFELVKKLEIENLTIFGANQSNTNAVILLLSTKFSKLIKITNLQIIDSSFTNSTILQINIGEGDQIFFNNFQLQSVFKNSNLFQTQTSNAVGNLFFKNFNLKDSNIQNSKCFINLKGFSQTTLANFSIVNTIFKNIQFLLLNQLSFLNYFNIYNCNFASTNIGIFNTIEDQISQSQYFEVKNINISENKYSLDTKLILFTKFLNYLSKTQIFNLLISNNQISNTNEKYNQFSLNSSLINLQIEEITLFNVKIYRGFGINDICIFSSQKVVIKGLEITQNEQFRFPTLHSSLDCLLQMIPSKRFSISLTMFSIQNLILQDCIISNIISFNSPIIYYQSENVLKMLQNENFKFINFTIFSNIIILTKLQNKVSLIIIESFQDCTINFTNISIINNILQEYQQDSSTKSALGLNLNILNGTVYLSNSNFEENQVFNTTSSLIYMKTNKLVIINCNFDKNNQFYFDRMRQYLIWTFQITQQVYIEDILNQFPIKSLSGNGELVVESLELITSNISNSQGQNGAGFFIIAQKNCSLKMENLILKSLRTQFKLNDENGGAFHIDGSQAQQIYCSFKKIKGSQIFSRTQGGLIYILIGAIKSKVIFNEIIISNVFSLEGSFLYIEFQENSNMEQNVFINQLFFNSSNNGWKQFLNLFSNITIYEQNLLANKRSTIQINQGKTLVISSSCFYSLQFEQAIQLINLENILFQNLIFQNSFIANSLIFIQPSQYDKSKVLYADIHANNITIGDIPLKSNLCENQNKHQSSVFSWLCNIKFNSVPLQLQAKEDQQDNLSNCLIQQLSEYLDMSSSGLFQFYSLSQENVVNLNNVNLANITCSKCNNGLIWFSTPYTDKQTQTINQLHIVNSQCGTKGCLVVDKVLNSSRIMINEEQLTVKQTFSLKISNFICQNNVATNGTCLYLIEGSAIITNAVLTNNLANQAGGAIYIQDSLKVLIIKSVIENNNAQYGGGIYLKDLQQLLYPKLHTLVYSNSAKRFSNDIQAIPSKLLVSLGFNSSIQIITEIYQTYELTVETAILNSETYVYGIKSKNILLPNGQKISDYKIFDRESQSYKSLNLQLRIQAVDINNNFIKGLNNTFCESKYRIYDTSKKESNQSFSTGVNIYFNETSQDYNLDDQIFYFDNDLPADLSLQLQFYCSVVYVPTYNDQFPYEIISQHNNYYFRLNVRSFPCQLGEIKNVSKNTCELCDSEKGLFSLQINQTKCEVKNDVSTISVTPVQLQLRAGFWRPQFYSALINECYNFKQNCLGGWAQGNQLCYLGHIGALCEQCDIYNIRGEGHFTINSKFQCGSCVDKWKNYALIVLISIWTILSITISVQGTIRSLEEKAKITNLKFINLNSLQRTVQTAILIKMLTNYFQIISSATTFRLDISLTLQTIVQAAGSPIQPLLYSLDCFLITMFKIEILYAKIIWQLIMPFIYINAFFLFYIIAVKLKFMEFNKSSITTSIIYLYIYFQPSLIGELIGLISYRDISGNLWVSSNVAYRYDTNKHFEWMIKFCSPIIIVLSILIPLYLFFRLFKNKQAFTKKSTKLYWGYLYNEYTEKAFFWEILKIVQKELIIIVLTFYDDFVVLKAMIILFILLVYLNFNKRFQPYKNIHLNTLDYYTTYVCLITFSLAIAGFITQQQNMYEFKLLLYVLIIIFNANLLLIFMKTIFNEIAYEMNQKYLKQLDEIRLHFRKKFPIINQIACLSRYFQSQSEKQLKVQKNFKKLKEFVIPKVKEIVKYKNFGMSYTSKSSQPTLTIFKSLDNSDLKNELKEKPLKKQLSASIMLKGDIQEPPVNVNPISNQKTIKKDTFDDS